MSEIQNYGKITATIGAASLIFNDYVIALTEIEGGHRLTATRGSEVQAIDVMDGRTLNPRGAWDAAAKYAQYDTVSHNQGAYVALQPSQGVEPAPGAYWAVLVDNAEAVRATEAALEAAKRADAAEAERAGAEQARVENETARAAAERVRAENEAVRAEAENGRVTAEDGRSNAESARVSAEQGRVAAEQNRQSAEQERSAAESARTEAEQGRANAEAERAEAETERANAENARVQAEQGRAAAENSRVSAEAGRAEAEAARVQAEALRVEAETARAAEMEEMAAEVNAAVEAAQELIQDDVIAGGSTWSSKQIIDAICPPLEETGNPVQCYPVAGYPLGVKASWEPRQEGTGDPSPENVRPITGLDEVRVTRAGKNLIPITADEPLTTDGVTWTVSDGVIHAQGTASSTSRYVAATNILAVFKIFCKCAKRGTQRISRARGLRLRACANAATASAAWPWQVAGEMLKWGTDGRLMKVLIPVTVGTISIAFSRRSVKAGVERTLSLRPRMVNRRSACQDT